MARLAAFRPTVVGYIVFGGYRGPVVGGPAYYLLDPDHKGPGRLFPNREAAAARAKKIAPTDDWWVEPRWKP